MASREGKLTQTFCDRVGTPRKDGEKGRRYADGRRLYLQTSFNKQGEVRKQWVWRYTFNGQEQFKGLGGYPTISLKAARKMRDELNVKLSNGRNPIDEEHAAEKARKLEALRTLTFTQVAEKFLEHTEKGGERATRIAKDWRTQISHVLPTLGDMPLQEIGVEEIAKALEPIWFKPVLGLRARSALEKLFDFAKGKTRKYYRGDNPATATAIKSELEPAAGRDRHVVKHREAMPLGELPAFLARAQEAQQTTTDPWDASPFVLEFLVLTASRLGTVRKMRWREVGVEKSSDPISDMWICPAEHMKGGREFGVPLSPEAIAVLKRVRDASPFRHGDDLVFVGVGGAEQGRNTAMRYMNSRLGVPSPGPTIHGFRSCFKFWATQVTNGGPRYPRLLSELALDHVVGDKTELAYLRRPDGNPEDFRYERRDMMVAWASFCAGSSSNSSSKPSKSNVSELRRSNV